VAQIRAPCVSFLFLLRDMGACGSSQLPRQQLDLMQAAWQWQLSCKPRRRSPTDVGHVAALDVINSYQMERAARPSCGPYARQALQDDPETRFLELLKRWLRQHAGSTSVGEEEVRSMGSLCRDVLNHQKLFPTRGAKGLSGVLVEVYDQLRWQLCETLEKDQTCAELLSSILSLCRNMVSDSIAYLLSAPTTLRQTDDLCSLEVVVLWQSLPSEGHPLDSRADIRLQKQMRDAWGTRCGSLLAALLRSPSCIRLFDNAYSVDVPSGAAASLADAGKKDVAPLHELIREAEVEFERGCFKGSGMAASFREPEKRAAWQCFLAALQAVGDVAYLGGEVLLQFQRLGAGLGDYGVISVARCFHAVLDAFVEKLRQLRKSLEMLNGFVDEAFVLSRARGATVKQPRPSQRMSARAHSAIERALLGRSPHLQALMEAIEHLKGRAAPERLPHVAKGLGGACTALQALFASPEFRNCVGGDLPELHQIVPEQSSVQSLALSDGSASPQNGLRLLLPSDGIVPPPNRVPPHARSSGSAPPHSSLRTSAHGELRATPRSDGGAHLHSSWRAQQDRGATPRSTSSAPPSSTSRSVARVAGSASPRQSLGSMALSERSASPSPFLQPGGGVPYNKLAMREQASFSAHGGG